jgi:hypothetical protein
MKDPDNGKGFSPSEHVEDEDEAIATSGGGKQFSPNVKDPEHDERARKSEGSAKEFAPDVQDPDAEEDQAGGKGSGKQFEPGRHEL